MKRNIVLLVGVIASIVIIILIDFVFTIGDKIFLLGKQFNINHLNYVFYAICVILAVRYLIWPVIKIFRAPSMPDLHYSESAGRHELQSFYKKLAQNCNYIKDDFTRKSHELCMEDKFIQVMDDVPSLKIAINEELTIRIKGSQELNVEGINQIILDWGKTAFMATAICQNSKLDTIGMILLNYKMVTNIIKASGFRPSDQQLFRIYIRILLTALLTYSISEALADTDNLLPANLGVVDGGIDDDGTTGVAVIDGISGFLKKIIGIVPDVVKKSIVDGTANLLLTLRIGYVTRDYLINGVDNLLVLNDRVKIKQKATFEAISNAAPIVKAGTEQIINNVKTMVSEQFLKKNKETDEE